jgi:MFS family permease
MIPARSTDPHDPLAPFRSRDYRLLSVFVLATALIDRSQSVAVGWDLYERTGSPLALGWVGLAQFLPVILLFLPAGHLADVFDRRWVAALSMAIWGASSALLAGASLLGAAPGWIYLAAACVGAAQVINRPARDALLPQLLAPETLARAVAWNAGLFQFASIVGPVAAGMLIAATGTAATVYLADLALALVAALAVALISRRRIERQERPRSPRELLGGLEHVWRTKAILGVITLDLFAVLFGGVTALLPVFAKDILHVGPAALGWLTSAPAIGALSMSIALGAMRPFRRPGRAFVGSVAGFGAAIIVFGLSPWFGLSLAALLASGALDSVSVVIRATVAQRFTPDALRGRVSAVNRVFISSSNELGAFESGLLAAFTGPVFTAVFGGAATIAFVLGAMRLFPELRRMGRLGR